MRLPAKILEQLKTFHPINLLNQKQLIIVEANTRIKEYPADHVLFDIGEEDEDDYFLMKGRVILEAEDGEVFSVEADSDSAHRALAHLRPRKYRARTASNTRLALIPNKTVNTLLEELPRESPPEFQARESQSVTEADEILASFNRDLASNNLTLPSLPDVALQIRQLMEDPNVTFKDISDVLKNDPAMTAKILKTCNSPIYRSVGKISSVQDAVARLGFSTTRQLVTLFAISELFKTDSPALQTRIADLWEQSREVAAIAYVLAKITPGVNAETALLAGLLQDTGVIPVLSYLQRFPETAEVEQKLDFLTRKLKRTIGPGLLTHWAFPEEICEVARHSEDWLYESAQLKASYADVVIAAQAYTLINRGSDIKLPPFASIPALKKLGEHGLSAEQSDEILAQSRQQIEELQVLLSPEPIPLLK